MNDPELRAALASNPAIGIELRLTNGMDEAAIWARAQAWAAQELRRLELEAAATFKAAPIQAAPLHDDPEP